MLAAGMAIGVMAPFWVSWHHSHDKEHLFKINYQELSV